MRNIIVLVVLLFCSFLSMASYANPVNIYEKPDSKSNIVSSIKDNDQIMPIFYVNKEWVKVANLKNGDVGWMKAEELKGPMIITKIHGSKIQQQIVVNKNSKSKEPVAYSITQYSSANPAELKPEDAEKIFKQVEERNTKIKASVQKMQVDMQKTIQEMFKDFDKNFSNFPVIQPIVVTSEKNIKNESAK